MSTDAPHKPPAPTLSESAERLLTTVASTAEDAIVRSGTALETGLAKGLTALADRFDAAFGRAGKK
ncbi:MAG: hypothetical protein ABI969_13560 [bacterium]